MTSALLVCSRLLTWGYYMKMVLYKGEREENWGWWKVETEHFISQQLPRSYPQRLEQTLR